MQKSRTKTTVYQLYDLRVRTTSANPRFFLLETIVRGYFSSIVRSTDSLHLHAHGQRVTCHAGGGGEACSQEDPRLLMQQRTRKDKNDIATSIWLVEPVDGEAPGRVELRIIGDS